jgi:Protein of unknown function (DUF2924)
MARVVIDPAVPETLDNEIARLRGLDLAELRARWHTVFRRRAPPHLPRHLLFRILAYRLQADRLGELDADSRRLLDRIGSGSSEGINRLVADFNRPRTELRPGTLLTREWDGHLQGIIGAIVVAGIAIYAFGLQTRPATRGAEPDTTIGQGARTPAPITSIPGTAPRE